MSNEVKHLRELRIPKTDFMFVETKHGWEIHSINYNSSLEFQFFYDSFEQALTWGQKSCEYRLEYLKANKLKGIKDYHQLKAALSELKRDGITPASLD